jgi:hypothetical protein
MERVTCLALVLGWVAVGCGGSEKTGAQPDGGEADASQDSSIAADTGAGSDTGGSGGDGAPPVDGSTGGDGAPTDGGPTDGAVVGDGGPTDGGGAVDYSVYQHHKNGTRDGFYIDPTLTKAAAATMHILPGFLGTVSVNVWAQPLYVENGPNGQEAFIIVTQTNHVTALDSAGKVVWDKTFGTPVPQGLLPAHCNSFNPIGIIGTPFIDGAGRVIYFDAMSTPDGATVQHLIYGISLDDGSVKTGWPVDVQSKFLPDGGTPGFQAKYQNQRGALQLVNGTVYVPYGGLPGDCQPYNGWVVGVPVASPQTPMGWQTALRGGGIWATGSLPTDGTSVFPVTGNTVITSATWGGGEAVIRLAEGPAFSGKTADYYAPSNWHTVLDPKDQDLGGANDVVFDLPGAAKPHLVLALGKDKNLYLLDRDNLGGIGSELLKVLVAFGGVNNDSNLIGSPAVYRTKQGTYAVFRVNGGYGLGCPKGQGAGNLVSMKITPNPLAATVAWCSNDIDLGSPMVTTTDGTSDAIVWDANQTLWAYDGDTGVKIVSGKNTKMSALMQAFNTPIAAKGRIVVAINGQVYVFTP